MRLTSLLAAALVVAGLAYWFVLRHDGGAEIAAAAVQETAEPAPAETRNLPVPVQVYESSALDIPGLLVLRGRTEANRNVQVAAETKGRVISEPLRRGAAVAEGQVLCRLDPGVRAADLAEAEAALAEAQVEADAADQLKRKGFTAETTQLSAQARLEAAQARVDAVAWDITQLEIRAPFDGVLESDTAEMGAFLTSGMYCANVIDLSRVKVSAFAAERDIERISVGQTATARLINGVVAEGKITFVSRVSDPDTRTFEIDVDLANTNDRLRDGMTAELLIELPAEPSHLLPQSALTLNDQGELGVRLDVDGIARFVPVDIVSERPDGVLVTGLPSKSLVIVVGQEFVRDGRAVKGTVMGAL